MTAPGSPHTLCHWQVFPTIAAALASSPKVSTLAKLVAANPVLSKAAADPTTNVTLLAPVNKVCARAGSPAAGQRGAHRPAPRARRPLGFRCGMQLR